MLMRILEIFEAIAEGNITTATIAKRCKAAERSSPTNISRGEPVTMLWAGIWVSLLLLSLPIHAVAKNCSPPHAVYGLIGNKWRALGGSDGPLGCPITDEMDHHEGKGRYQKFEYGEMAWSPNTGRQSVQAAYLSENGMTVEWGDTSPFNYDVFLVRWDKDGQNIGQQDVSGGNRTGGKWTIPYSGLGRYRIVVEGCDRHTLSSSTCRQGWSNPIYVVYTGAPLHGNAQQGAPFNLIAHQADVNGLPLNPAWAVQLAGTPHPDADHICFDMRYGRREAHFERCTTQQTMLDTARVPHEITCAYGATSPIHGHVNWYVATFAGIVYWIEEAQPDGDYNFMLATPGDPAVTVANLNHRMKLEFDSDETIDHFQTPWWSELRRLVDDDNGDAIVKFMGGKQAIAIGLVGLDCVHECGSELHPLYAMAMNVKNDDPNDDVWAMFARNWGNEGWCSHYRHQLQKNDFIFRLPWRTGAIGVEVLNQANDRRFLTNNGQVSGPNVTWAVNQGVDVAFHLPGPEAEARINGELHLRWLFPASLQNRMKTSTSAVRPDSAVSRPALHGQLGGEEQMHDLFNRLPPAQKKNVRTAILAKPALDNLPAKVTVNLSHALRPIPAVSIARVDTKEDTEKAARDQRRLEAFCAAYNNHPPGMEAVCPKSMKPKVTNTPAKNPAPKRSIVNQPPQSR